MLLFPIHSALSLLTLLCQLAQKTKGLLPFSTLLGVSSPLPLLEPSHPQSPRTKSKVRRGKAPYNFLIFLRTHAVLAAILALCDS